MTGQPQKRTRRSRSTSTSGLPPVVDSVSTAVADKPAAPKIKTPEQLAKMLASGCRGMSKVLVIVLLDLEERYVMTDTEAKNIADPAARMLMRVKALRKPLKWLTGSSDEIALIAAIGAYSMRLIDPVSVKIDTARTAAKMRAQLQKSEQVHRGTTQPIETPKPATNQGNPGSSKPVPANGNGAVLHPAAFAGFAPESSEAGAFLIPGVGFGFRE